MAFKYKIDTRKLDSLEFNMLSGTDSAVRMIRNRAKFINIDVDQLATILEYLDYNAVDQYHVRQDNDYQVVIYFESPIDKENIISFLNQNNP